MFLRSPECGAQINDRVQMFLCLPECGAQINIRVQMLLKDFVMLRSLFFVSGEDTHEKG